MYDVAKAAGVSPKTVSRVLNGDAPVNARTREAVEAAMATLHYVPSSAARSMRSNKTGLIGMITGAISASPNQDEPVGLPEIFLVQGVQRALADAGLTLLIADTGGHSEKVGELAHTLLRHRVEGLIYVADYHREVQLPAALRGTPVVLTNCFDSVGTPAVLPDDEGGQDALVQRIVAAGHRRIGFLTLPDRQAARPLRLLGYQHALAAAGVAYDPDLVLTGAIVDPVHEYDFLWDALDRLLRASPTAICCANDKMALRVCALLRQRGLRVPEDISVAGYDDYRIITEHMDPPLTSIELPYAAMGMRAAEKLLRLINGAGKANEDARELVSGPVVWRNSVKTIQQVVTPFKTRRNDIS
ncbi:MAG TPA: LacI family DNA-binding transcriptional regulator [Devosia sp.]|nr:LacI family DNA-binding transcriptional regulator [Devosia sp.]